MELPRDVPPLGFLGLEEPAGEVAQPIGVTLQGFFRAPAIGDIHERCQEAVQASIAGLEGRSKNQHVSVGSIRPDKLHLIGGSHSLLAFSELMFNQGQAFWSDELMESS